MGVNDVVSIYWFIVTSYSLLEIVYLLFSFCRYQEAEKREGEIAKGREGRPGQRSQPVLYVKGVGRKMCWGVGWIAQSDGK